MTISELLQYCMAKPGAEQSVHNDWKATQIKVEDVLFAMVKEVENRLLGTETNITNWQRKQNQNNNFSAENQPGAGGAATSAAQRCASKPPSE